MHLPARIDHHAHGNRWTREHPVEKAAVFLFAVAAATTWPSPGGPLCVVVLALVIVQRAGIGVAALARAAALPFGFLLAAALPLVVSVQWPGGPALHLAPDGLHLAARTLLRSSALIVCTLTLALTTPVSQLIWLARRAGAPPALAVTALVTYRFLFHFRDTLATLHAAQRARGGFAGCRGSLRSSSLVAASLVGRTADQAVLLHRGLTARGGVALVPDAYPRWSRFRVAALTVAAAAMAGARLWW